jgi:hypothetical protein
MDGQALRLLIRQRLAAGVLPTGRMMRAWQGLGNRTLCHACAEVLAWDDGMVEGFTAMGAVMRFHTGCFELWDDERHMFR